MTDRSVPDHPDLETLSEWLDDPDAAGDAALAHVEHCELCQGRLGELRWARDSVAQPVPRLAAEQRDRAIADALAAMAEWGGGAAGPDPAAPAPVERPAAVAPLAPLAPARSRSRWWWVGSSAAAAVLVVVVATVALLGRGSNGGHNTALSSAPESGKAALSSGSSGATGGAASDGSTGDSAVSGGDLGDVPSIDVLRSRVTGATVARGQNSFNSSASPAPAAAPAVPVPNVVGTRVCEAEARTVQPQLGVVVYAANLRFQGTTAVVLGFAPTPGVPPATLLVLAPQEGCRLLAEATPS